MGYTTKFDGGIELSRALSLKEASNWLAIAENSGDRRTRPAGAPDSYLQWVPSKDLKHIVWDGEEKFGYYTEWLQWVIDTILKPAGIAASGEMYWTGEEAGDAGILSVIEGKAVARPLNLKHAGARNPGMFPLDERSLARMAIEQL